MLLYENVPKLDLHGFDRDYARIKTKEFLKDQIKLRESRIVIIHGNGRGILKKEVHEVLRREKMVERYRVDIFNTGCTLVDLKK